MHRVQTWHKCFGVQWGVTDLKAHMDTEKHKKVVRGVCSSTKLTEFFVRPEKSEDAKNVDALLKKAFPDSDTPKSLIGPALRLQSGVLNKGYMQHVQSRGSTGLELRTSDVSYSYVFSQKVACN